MRFDKIEKKLSRSFKVYISKSKEALTLFEKKTGLFKASIVRHETYPTPQFVYDLHIDNVDKATPHYSASAYHNEPTYSHQTVTVCETYNTFEEAINALLKNV